MPEFTNQDTKDLYNGDNQFYKSVWDPNGSVHFGLFEEGEGPDNFVTAANRLNNLFIEKGGFDEESSILDVGSGTGAVADYVSKKTLSTIVGIDLSDVRIADAKIKGEDNDRISFHEMSADTLSFSDNSFTHVMSMSTLYHVHKKEEAIKEIHRVLQPEGKFIFEDFVRPNNKVSQESLTHVYNRLKYRTDFNHENYIEFLYEIGFTVLEDLDLSENMAKSYNVLTQILEKKIAVGGEEIEKYKKLYTSYPKMVEAIQRGDLGRSFYLCQKLET